ncbi:hypothetical protein DRO42_04080 [Candidatus Bathyarchaeota archaeon]|nr:MAG: hypothetical protein DRO42_04080 [Candidatus Bathyarchaeota archaeon]
MSDEEETRRLLRIREDLKRRMGRLQAEVEDLRRAVAEIDKLIARRGFRQPVPEPPEERGAISVKAKDGTVLGTMQADEREIIFTPRDDLAFTVSIPPFQAFLIDRVLANMRSTDEERASRGEIPPEDVLSYEVSTDGDRLLRLVVRNYGGERRLREIRSSLRWTFDKMYEKLTQS